MPNGLKSVWERLKNEPLLLILLAAAVVLEIVAPQPPAALLARIDWPTLASLAGLLMLTRVLESSGFLNWLAQRLIRNVLATNTA